MILSSENVEKVILSCLFNEGEDTSKHVAGIGIKTKIGFHPERLKANEINIMDMLLMLPDDFKRSKGGGMTFLNACMDNNGDQWTGDHSMVDRLFVLGNAIGKAEFLMPREMWDVLPGAMPYIVINDK